MKKILLIILAVIIITCIIICNVDINKKADYTTFKSIPGGKILIQGNNRILRIRFTPDSEKVIFIEGKRGEGNYFLKEYNLKSGEIKNIDTKINKGNIENIFFINNKLFLSVYDEIRSRRDIYHNLNNNEYSQIRKKYTNSSVVEIRKEIERLKWEKVMKIEEQYNYKLFEINTNNNYTIKETNTPIKLKKDHFQSQRNRRYFFEKYVSHDSIIINYPHIVKVFKIPENLKNEYTSILFEGFGRTDDEIILSAYKNKSKNIDSILFYNYKNSKINKRIDMSLIINGLLSPNGKYYLMFNVDLCILDLQNNELLDISIPEINPNKYKGDIDVAQTIDWSWDSKKIIVSLSDNIYIMDLDYLLKHTTKKTKVEVY